MAPTNPFLSAVPLTQLYVWVLAPYVESNDANINYYYDFSQSIAEYSRAFDELGVAWKWQPVTIKNYASVIKTITKENERDTRTHVVFNICDGDEVNGAPGISVVRMLEEKGLLYTGSDEFFYDITTSKIPMKQAFDKACIPTADWAEIRTREQDLSTIIEKLGSPVIVKPS